MNCNCCYTDYIGKCEVTLTINTRLQGETEYTVVFTDKFENKYQVVVTTESDGTIVIPVADLPAGLLTEYSGDFQIQIYDGTCKPISFELVGKYDCISFHVKGGTFEKDAIGCPLVI